MSMLFVQVAEIEPERALKTLRNQAALVRALLDELERAAPPARGAGILQCAAAQLAEEVGRLSRRMRECADAMAGADVSTDGMVESKRGE
jgi:hypothetical protein